MALCHATSLDLLTSPAHEGDTFWGERHKHEAEEREIKERILMTNTQARQGRELETDEERKATLKRERLELQAVRKVRAATASRLLIRLGRHTLKVLVYVACFHCARYHDCHLGCSQHRSAATFLRT